MKKKQKTKITLLLLFLISLIGCASIPPTIVTIENDTGYTLTRIYEGYSYRTDYTKRMEPYSWRNIWHESTLKERQNNQGNYIPFALIQGESYTRNLSHNELSIYAFRFIDQHNMLYLIPRVDLRITNPVLIKFDDALPILTVDNKTGLSIELSSPVRTRLGTDNTTRYQIPYERQNKNIVINYRCGGVNYQESILLDSHKSIELTRRPSFVSVQNDMSATMINIQIRPSGLTGAWNSINILSIQLEKDGTAVRRDVGGVTQFVTDLTGSIVHGDSFRFWMGDLDLDNGNYDVRVDDVHGMAYLKKNVNIIEDITLIFTSQDKL